MSGQWRGEQHWLVHGDEMGAVPRLGEERTEAAAGFG
jgi:hypothetical protein